MYSAFERGKWQAVRGCASLPYMSAIAHPALSIAVKSLSKPQSHLATPAVYKYMSYITLAENGTLPLEKAEAKYHFKMHLRLHFAIGIYTTRFFRLNLTSTTKLKRGLH